MLLLLAGCADPYESPSLKGIRYESGNDQTGIAGGPLPQQLVVKAFNQSDAPIAGARVQFSAPSGTFDQRGNQYREQASSAWGGPRAGERGGGRWGRPRWRRRLARPGDR